MVQESLCNLAFYVGREKDVVAFQKVLSGCACGDQRKRHVDDVIAFAVKDPDSGTLGQLGTPIFERPLADIGKRCGVLVVELIVLATRALLRKVRPPIRC